MRGRAGERSKARDFGECGGAPIGGIDRERRAIGDLARLDLGRGRNASDRAPCGNLVERKRRPGARQAVRAASGGDGDGVEASANLGDAAREHRVAAFAAVEIKRDVVARRCVQSHAGRQDDIQPVHRREPDSAHAQGCDLRAVGQRTDLQLDRWRQHRQPPSIRPSACPALGSAADDKLPAWSCSGVSGLPSAKSARPASAWSWSTAPATAEIASCKAEA